MVYRRLPVWRPSDEQMAHWPAVSGNAINGVGEAAVRPPTAIYWHPPDTIPHGPVQQYFYARTGNDAELAEARRERQRAIDAPLAPIAEIGAARTPEQWSVGVKQAARDCGADDVGVALMRSEYVFQGFEAPKYKWIVVVAIEQDYQAIAMAPSMKTLVEVTRQYARGVRVAKGLANWLRAQGQDAFPYGGPMAGSFVIIPPAIEAGLGELGKHGSMIHPRFGANFRLACVLTDAPLIADGRNEFGADDFCLRCRVCSDACPPQAIAEEKVVVRGERRWYVDFEKCLPYFNEAHSCAICIAVCPFSRPEVGASLVRKLAAKRGRWRSGAVAQDGREGAA